MGFSNSLSAGDNLAVVPAHPTRMEMSEKITAAQLLERETRRGAREGV